MNDKINEKTKLISELEGFLDVVVKFCLGESQHIRVNETDTILLWSS